MNLDPRFFTEIKIKDFCSSKTGSCMWPVDPLIVSICLFVVPNVPTQYLYWQEPNYSQNMNMHVLYEAPHLVLPVVIVPDYFVHIGLFRKPWEIWGLRAFIHSVHLEISGSINFDDRSRRKPLGTWVLKCSFGQLYERGNSYTSRDQFDIFTTWSKAPNINNDYRLFVN